jgi:hypothetical protein
MSTIAKILVGVLAGFALIAVALLGWMRRRVRRRGGFGPKAGVWMRVLTPAILGIGGWFLGLLVMLTVWPAGFIGDLLVTVPPMGVAIGLGTYWAWVRRDRAPGTRRLGLAAALAGALLGAWFGFSVTEGLGAVVTTIVGATIIANLAALTVDIVRGQSATGTPTSSVPLTVTTPADLVTTPAAR